MLHDDRRRAGSFGEDAEQYDRARPGYPGALIDDLIADVSAEPNGRSPFVLDVGCGTGKVGRLFTARGCTVLGVEPDERMATVARRHGLTVEVATFESWDPQDRTFDLVVAGQTWHWVEPDVGARKSADVLRPNGRVAVFWNRAALPASLDAAMHRAYEPIAPELAAGSILLGNVSDSRFTQTADSFRRVASLCDVSIRTYRRGQHFTRAQWLDVLPTHSDHRTLPQDRLVALTTAVGAVIDAFGGGIDVTYDTIVVSARALH